MSRILRQVLQVGLGVLPVLAFVPCTARADIPADYTGTPYKGTPSGCLQSRVDGHALRRVAAQPSAARRD